MPPEPLPWDRKDFFKERKHERSGASDPPPPLGGGGGGPRWREPPPHHYSSSRWVSDFRTRAPGHGKQGGWHLYSEEPGHAFTPSRSNDKIPDEDSFRPFGSRGDAKYSRSSREGRGSFGQKDWKGHSWETAASPNGPVRPTDVSDQRLIDGAVTCGSYNSHSDLASSWDLSQPKDQHNKNGGCNGLPSTAQRFERESSLDWRPLLKWNRSGSLLSSRGSFSHSSSSKSLGADSNEMKGDVQGQPRNLTSVQSPSGDAAACVTSAAPSEETSSRKKPRLGWGEGLAKYEKKKVDGPDENSSKSMMAIYNDNAEPAYTHPSNMAEKSPGIAHFSDCASPATPSSVACSSSPGLEDKHFAKVGSDDHDTTNLNDSPSIAFQSHSEGSAFNLGTLDVTEISSLNSSINELLQSDDVCSVESGYVRSTAVNKLLVWKVDVLKALEKTESEIDSLENELKSLAPNPSTSFPGLAAADSLPGESHSKSCDGHLAASNSSSRPALLHIVSPRDVSVEKVLNSREDENGEVKNENIDSPGSATSKFVDVPSSGKDLSTSDMVIYVERLNPSDTNRSRDLEMESSKPCLNASVDGSQPTGTSFLGLNAEKADNIRSSMDGSQPLESGSSAVADGGSIDCYRRSVCFDLIWAANKESANSAFEVLDKLLCISQCGFDISRAFSASGSQVDPVIKDRFLRRKRFLWFKERMITLKFRAFQHLWKEDIRLLSVRKFRAKSRKGFELCLRTVQNSYQKHRSSIRSRFSSPAGNVSLVPTSDIINFTSKLLSDSQVKVYRNTLKMPALILDKREKTLSRFISDNGLVEDPCAIEKERSLINPWTLEEQEIFIDKLATFGKDFKKIASFLSHKTTADCIEFYYKNHKSECFEKTRKKPEYAKKGSSSANTYLVAAGKRWNREANAVSLDILGAASMIAANVDEDMEIHQKCASKYSFRMSSDHRISKADDGPLNRSKSPEMSNNDREAVAADVLAGICGSLSSEAMSSCITSSVDPGEGYNEWKYQRGGSSNRRPLTPEMMQNVDDETCSDESCGEMDPVDWTDEEKSIFIQAVRSYGKDFVMISRCVRTKSREQCKVFFSKARKCLGLDTIHPVPSSLVNGDANGGGSDTEDACNLEAGSVVCSEKLGPKVEEDPASDDTSLKHESHLEVSTNVKPDLNTSEDKNGTGDKDSVDMEDRLKNVVSDCCAEGNKPGREIGGAIKGQIDANSVSLQSYENMVAPSEIEAGVITGRVNNNSKQTSSGAETRTEVVAGDSAGQCSRALEGEGDLLSNSHLSENMVEDGHGELDDLSGQKESLLKIKSEPQLAWGASHPTADRKDSSCGFDVLSGSHERRVLETESAPKAHAISLQQDFLPQGSAAIENEKTSKLDKLPALDLEKISDEQDQEVCQKDAQPISNGSLLDHVESLPVLRGYPLPLSMKENGSMNCKKQVALQNTSSGDRNFHSDRYSGSHCYLQKCSSSKHHSPVAELPFPNQDQRRDHPADLLENPSNVEKPCRNGDVKLFGQILSKPTSQQKPNCSMQQTEGSSQPSKVGSNSFNVKFADDQPVDNNSAPAKFEHNNLLGSENLPVNFGFWDNRIQTGYSSLPDSTLLLSKYPAAFSNYAMPSAKIDQSPLQGVVKGGDRNGVSVFPTREVSSSNVVADYQLYRNREVQPFTIDMKQRQDVVFPEMPRRNGFDVVPGVQPQARGVVGINVVGRAGILVSGQCTGVSDPVAALKMHYAKAEQFTGQAGGMIREDDSWRGKGDVGR